jgi:hypothetical protein
MVHMMGGDLRFESQVGKDSHFFFVLTLPPAQRRDGSSRAPATPTPVAASTRHGS